MPALVTLATGIHIFADLPARNLPATKPWVTGASSEDAPGHGERIASTLSPASVDLRLLVVTAVDQDFLPVSLVDDHRLEQIGWHHLHAIFVGGGVVHRHGLAAERRVHHVGGDLGEVAGVLEDR